jgi:hypothetical protein
MKFDLEKLKAAMKQPETSKAGASFVVPSKIISVNYSDKIVKWFKK